MQNVMCVILPECLYTLRTTSLDGREMENGELRLAMQIELPPLSVPMVRFVLNLHLHRFQSLSEDEPC